MPIKVATGFSQHPSGPESTVSPYPTLPTLNFSSPEAGLGCPSLSCSFLHNLPLLASCPLGRCSWFPSVPLSSLLCCYGPLQSAGHSGYTLPLIYSKPSPPSPRSSHSLRTSTGHKHPCRATENLWAASPAPFSVSKGTAPETYKRIFRPSEEMGALAQFRASRQIPCWEGAAVT